MIPEPPETLASFAAAHHIGYPLLSDPGAAIITRLGVLDATSVAGQPVPYAGSFLLDAEGRIQAKFFEADTEYRRTAASILSLAEPRPAAARRSRPRSFTARPWASNANDRPRAALHRWASTSS